MNEYIPTEDIQDSLRGVLELLPLVYVIIVIMAVIGFGIIKFDGSTVKYYRAWIIGIGIALAGIAYLFYPEDEVKVRDIPTLILGCIASLFTLEYFIYRRKNKSKKK